MIKLLIEEFGSWENVEVCHLCEFFSPKNKDKKLWKLKDHCLLESIVPAHCTQYALGYHSPPPKEKYPLLFCQAPLFRQFSTVYWFFRPATPKNCFFQWIPITIKFSILNLFTSFKSKGGGAHYVVFVTWDMQYQNKFQ